LASAMDVFVMLPLFESGMLEPVPDSFECLLDPARLPASFLFFLQMSSHSLSNVALSYTEKGLGGTLYDEEDPDTNGGRGERGSSIARGDV
jgi:hypothetical protein